MIVSRGLRKERTIHFMAMQFVKRDTLPVAQKGRSAGPSVSVSENGQVTFNAASCTHLGGREVTKVAVAFDKESGKFAVYPSTHAAVKKAKLADESLFVVRYTKEKNKKGQKQALAGTISSMSSMLRDRGYEYKKSGQQSFPVTLSDAGVLGFELPSGALMAKPKVARKKKATASTPVAASGPVEVPPTTESTEELVLDVA